MSTVVTATVEQLGDPIWRIGNLYFIIDETGKKIPFRLNEEQEHFLRSYWYLNVILKARQLGFTTLIDIILLDQCFFVPNTSAGIIAHNLDDAGKIFRNKIRFPYDNLTETIRRANPLVKESESELVWKNGSSISVGTSMRSGTLQLLHVSEFGKIARRYPEKAQEITTGAFNAVHAGQFIFVESTAEGRGGDFFELVKNAKKTRDGGRKLTTMDWKLHFYPWWLKRSYTLNDSAPLTKELQLYFAELLKDHGIKLTPGQMAWYAKKSRDMKAHMKREHPSYEDEAFEAANEEKYYARAMSECRKAGHIRNIPIAKAPVNTFWDIGRDTTSIWFHQYIALEHRFVDYEQGTGGQISDYIILLQKKPYVLGTIYLPHDAKDESLASSDTVEKKLQTAFPSVQIKVIPRTKWLAGTIDNVRSRIPECWFHEENCAKGIDGLENFRKKWSEPLGNWLDDPVHDWASHPASAFHQFVDGWDEGDTKAAAFRPKWSAQTHTIGDRVAGY